MKISLAQIRPEPGNFNLNLEKHLSFIRNAANLGTHLIAFPELSLTGYEPGLARELATGPDDESFRPLQQLCNELNITTCAGMPIVGQNTLQIAMLIFRAFHPKRVYVKKYLHPDEEPFFAAGESYLGFLGPEEKIAPAICYELSVPEHSERAHRLGAKFYLASVAKNQKGVVNAFTQLEDIARRYQMTTLMSNCTGPFDGDLAAGSSAVWHSNGELLAQLGESEEGIICFDTLAAPHQSTTKIRL